MAIHLSYPESLALVTLVLAVFAGTALLTTALAFVGLKYLAGFISKEVKPGRYRSDVTSNAFQTSRRLPNVGGLAALLAMTIVLLALSLSPGASVNYRWFLLPIWYFAIVGLIDDARKYAGAGLDERLRFSLIMVGSFGIAHLLYFRMGYDVPFQPYSLVAMFQVPVIWAIWWYASSTVLTLVTTTSVGLSDGMDGLTAGLWLIASAAFTVIALLNQSYLTATMAATMAGAAAGLLVFNAPSRWNATMPRELRRARLYIGESGALIAGSACSLVVLLSQTELQWLLIGGMFLAEGGSALFQAKIATPIFRRHLKMLRYAGVTRVPHSVYPLPFLATPIHAHFDMIGLGRFRTVVMFWLLATVLSAVGVTSMVVDDLFAKTVIWLVGIAILVGFFLYAMMTKSGFLGYAESGTGGDQVVAVFHGKPMRFVGIPLYVRREITELSASRLEARDPSFARRFLYHELALDDLRIALAEMFEGCGMPDHARSARQLIPPALTDGLAPPQSAPLRVHAVGPAEEVGT